MEASVLIVDDEQFFLNSVTRKLRLEGFSDLTPVADPTTVPAMLKTRAFDAAFLDITMPGMNGLDLLKVIKETSPATECIMVTANEDIPSVIRAVKLGAYDYLVKPIQPDRLAHALRKALEHKQLMDVIMVRQDLPSDRPAARPAAFEDIITQDDQMLKVIREAGLHARSDIPVLIVGETGTGKELMAQAIHRASPRASGPFVAVNMIALTVSLFESEFFGHAKGAFTGALQDKEGYLARARGGTLFLDEIGDLPLEIQGKLLRIFQEGEYVPVGKTRPERANVRFVAATNRNLEKLVAAEKFRKDLYYRLRFAYLHLPPLRERIDDITLLTDHFLNQSSKPGISLAPAAEGLLMTHSWPGNIRELKGVIEASVNLCQSGEIMPGNLNLNPLSPTSEEPVGGAEGDPAADAADHPFDTLAKVEKQHIIAVYHALKRNKTHTARALDIGLATLQRKLKSYGVK